MSLTPVTVQQFGGLNLVDDPQEVGAGAAVDLLNVDLDPARRGRVRSRDGYGQFTFAEGSNPYSDIHAFYKADGTTQLLAVILDDKVSALNSTGTVSTSLGAAPFSSPNHVVFANFGVPATGAADELEYVYFGDGNETMRRWDGSAFSAPANMPKGCPYLFPRSSRLVATCFNAGSHVLGPSAGPSSQSHVYFSDAGAPETWGANNYVILTPGDGERIHGAASWRELFFVFKRSRFFVFTGESTDSSGEPIFNYRTVDTGVGLSGYGAGMEACGAIATGPDGVYFLNERGVWRTSGDAATRVSAKIDPFFDGTASTSITTSATRLRDARMTWHDERLWVSVATDGSSHNDLVLVYDPAIDVWLMYDIPAFGMASLRIDPRADLLFAYATGTNDIGRHSSAYTTDDGVAISSHYQSGFYELGPSGSTAFTRWTRAWGSGAPTVGVLTDMGSTDSRAAAVTLGTSPAVDEGYHQQSYEGQLFSHKISASSAWSVSRLQHDVAAVKP